MTKRWLFPNNSEHFWTTGIDAASAARKAKEAEAVGRLEAQERLIETLTAALKPFAKRANGAEPGFLSSVKDEWLITARTALAQARKG